MLLLEAFVIALVNMEVRCTTLSPAPHTYTQLSDLVCLVC
jgi:hypothetical protein